uniref:replication helicase subunit n=1 Tax=Phyllorhiza punctata TaxID=493932 RepID=UPI002A7EFCD1|nr:replication helicase subunit [Phyllorhiza punctata]WOE91030.1 replication helicase subunit [Phyllorhiza punctata]
MSLKHFYNSLKTLQLNTIKLYKKKGFSRFSIPKISENVSKAFEKETLVPKNLHSNRFNTNLGPTVNVTQSKVKRVSLIDVNSLYPFSLINKYPAKSNQKKKKMELYFTKYKDEPNFQRTKYIYKNKYTNIHTRPQLENLKKKKYIIQTQKITTHYNTYTNTILHLYKNKYTNIHTKLLLNSFYGKIHKNNKIVASLMLHYAKMYIHKIRTIPDNPCCYSDTDSAILRHPPKQKISNSIGQFKHKSIDKLTIIQPRNYSYYTNNRKSITHKGIAAKAKNDITLPKDFIHIIKLLII